MFLFCQQDNTTVIGGLQKLTDTVENDYIMKKTTDLEPAAGS